MTHLRLVPAPPHGAPEGRATACSSKAGAGRELRLLHRGDLDLLAWAGEQYAIRLDQLQLLLGCAPSTARRVVARLGAAGMASTRRVLVDEPMWIVPTAAGLRACASPYGVWEPRLGALTHVAAVNDVRLHVRALSGESRWVCERALARERNAGEHLPDAVAIVDGRRVAVEVELTVKTRRRVEAILDELSARFEAVVYFCAPGAHRLLGELERSGRWPRLAVRELPVGETVGRRVERDS